MSQSLAWQLGDRRPTGWNMTLVQEEPGGQADRVLAALSEADLVAACLSNHPGAFDLIVERHRRPVYQLCYRFGGNHEDARDLLQEVFLRAYRGLRNFRGQSSLSTWLYRIGVTVSLNRVTAERAATAPIERPH